MYLSYPDSHSLYQLSITYTSHSFIYHTSCSGEKVSYSISINCFHQNESPIKTRYISLLLEFKMHSYSLFKLGSVCHIHYNLFLCFCMPFTFTPASIHTCLFYIYKAVSQIKKRWQKIMFFLVLNEQNCEVTELSIKIRSILA